MHLPLLLRRRESISPRFPLIRCCLWLHALQQDQPCVMIMKWRSEFCLKCELLLEWVGDNGCPGLPNISQLLCMYISYSWLLFFMGKEGHTTRFSLDPLISSISTFELGHNVWTWVPLFHLPLAVKLVVSLVQGIGGILFWPGLQQIRQHQMSYLKGTLLIAPLSLCILIIQEVTCYVGLGWVPGTF